MSIPEYKYYNKLKLPPSLILNTIKQLKLYRNLIIQSNNIEWKDLDTKKIFLDKLKKIYNECNLSEFTDIEDILLSSLIYL